MKMMMDANNYIKKFLIALVLVFAVVNANSQMYRNHRYVELTVDAGAGINQNFGSVDEVFVKEFVLDFSEISDNFGKEGMVLAGNVNTGFALNVNCIKLFQFGLEAGVDGSFRASTGKGLFDILGKGNPGGSFGTTASVEAEVFSNFSIPVKARYYGFGITVTPNFFTPLFYVPHSEIKFSGTSDEQNTLSFTGKGRIPIYSNFDIGKNYEFTYNEKTNRYESEFEYSDDQMEASDVTESFFGNGGFNLGIEVEYHLFDSLDVAGYTNLPVVPGKLKYKTPVYVDVTATVNPALDSVVFTDEDDDEDDDELSDVDSNCFLTQTEDASYKVHKPFRLGAKAAYRPCGNLLTLRPEFGFAVRNPGSPDFNADSDVFAEYRLEADLELAKVFNLSVSTEYQDKIFAQHLGFGLNFRVLEMVFDFASTSSSFAKTWQVSGLEANVGIRLGF